ncbi:MAG: ABC transporter permease [Gemmobacter sp.]
MLLDTLAKAAFGAGLCVGLAYPLAYAIHFLAGRRLALLLMAAITVPFFASYPIRAFSWRLVLGRNGPINTALVQSGITDAPVDGLLFSDFAVMVGLVASYMPFAAFPLLLAMRRISPGHLAAAQDLGAGFWHCIRTIAVPLTLPGLFAGFLFVFAMIAGSSTEVQMLGGRGRRSCRSWSTT